MKKKKKVQHQYFQRRHPRQVEGLIETGVGLVLIGGALQAFKK